MADSRAELEQAALWRDAARQRLLVAEMELEEAVAGMPVSLERVQAKAALDRTRKARSTAERVLMEARRRIEAIDRGGARP